jgi:membrane fusion protein (multidrug efflux system)
LERKLPSEALAKEGTDSRDVVLGSPPWSIRRAQRPPFFHRGVAILANAQIAGSFSAPRTSLSWNPSKLRMQKPKFLSLVLIASAVASMVGCKPKAATTPAPPPEVEVMHPIERDEPIFAEWIGSLDGLVNAQVRAQVTGYLMRQTYAEGSPVKKGDLLFEVDPRTFQAVFDQATVAAEKAEADYKRIQELAAKQVVARQDYDNAVSARAAALASLEQARLNLEFTRIKAPIDGVAGMAAGQIGDLVGPGSGVLTTVSTVDPIKAYFSVSEQAYLQFKREPAQEGSRFPEDLELELILSDGTVYPQKGKFFAIDRQIDPGTGTLRIAGTFPNPDNLLRPGQYAHIRARVHLEKNALEVPQRAVSELQGGYQLAIVGPDNVAHLRTVKVGRRVGANWIIASGLQPDEQVVVEGLQKVKEGTVVAPKPFAVAAVK